jgi:predicted kinase
VVQLVLLNGPPGIGKSTVAELYVDRHAGVLNLDVDIVHRLIGGWQELGNRTWQIVWPLVRVMAATHLRGGRDVVLPQYHAKLEEISALEDLARENGARFREIVLLDAREAAAERFGQRARDSDDPWIQHHHRNVVQLGGSEVLGLMYDNLMEVLRLRPEAVVVRAAAGAMHETYELLLDALA